MTGKLEHNHPGWVIFVLQVPVERKEDGMPVVIGDLRTTDVGARVDPDGAGVGPGRDQPIGLVERVKFDRPGTGREISLDADLGQDAGLPVLIVAIEEYGLGIVLLMEATNRRRTCIGSAKPPNAASIFRPVASVHARNSPGGDAACPKTPAGATPNATAKPSNIICLMELTQPNQPTKCNPSVRGGCCFPCQPILPARRHPSSMWSAQSPVRNSGLAPDG